jgi:1,4-alpha-glucan branching enzyme
VFTLKGFQNASNVVVTGNFYNWNPRGLPMTRTSAGWALPVYLREGTYAYKFLADGRWMTDPGNPKVRNDARGNQNSFLEIGEPYLFKLDGFTDAEKVVLTGSFNRWDITELVMNRTPSGWQLPYVMPAGNYEYKYILDGKWMTDPVNPFTTGSGDYTNSFIALNPNHIFELEQHQDAKKVIVTGSFNGWSTRDYRMARQGGKWILPVSLKPGKYTYKFIVDGKWITDPANKLYEENEYGTGNSVLWIDPS